MYEPITADVFATTISDESTDAAYDLTKVGGLTYAQTDFATGELRNNNYF